MKIYLKLFISVVLATVMSFCVFTNNVHAYDSDFLAKRGYDRSRYDAKPGYIFVTTEYDEGSYWDGIVYNKKWSFYDLYVNNTIYVSYVGDLTTPKVLPEYVDSMDIFYQFRNTQYISNRTAIYSGFDLDPLLGESIKIPFHEYSKQSLYEKGVYISDTVKCDSSTKCKEYVLALYELRNEILVYTQKTKETGSWFKKSIVKDGSVSIGYDNIVIGYIALAVPILSDYDNGNYFINHYSDGKNLFVEGD